MVDMVFVLLKQSFTTDLAYFGRFVLINLAWQSNGPFVDTHVSINQIDIMQQIRLLFRVGWICLMLTLAIRIKPMLGSSCRLRQMRLTKLITCKDAPAKLPEVSQTEAAESWTFQRGTK